MPSQGYLTSEIGSEQILEFKARLREKKWKKLQYKKINWQNEIILKYFVWLYGWNNIRHENTKNYLPTWSLRNQK